MHASLRKELGARHSLLNLSVYNLVEEFARHRLELEAQLRKASEEEELAKTKKEKREKELDSLLDSDDYCLDSSLDINSKNNLEDEENKRQSLYKSRDGNRILHSRRLIDAYILYFKELLSNNSRIFANAIGIGKTQAIVLAVLIRYCNLSDLLALQFCFFSNSLSKNISRLTKEKAIEMRINTTNAISKALAAANKLVALQSYVLEGFVIVCSFRKIDKHVFRAYNTISSSYIEKRVILLLSYVTV
ncbi:hypothetical protein HBH56_040100 [Parastagonospora nodorum]|nr:hypothetical protein HBH56_040100 [Parastagonospora nodorum]KAH3933890.1 hypothetical protein HBH54_059360 [Parastagonospora nodorum]KAH4143115.1 hypothetical protein HBH45_040330 [Parastagonospora nodorum]KAH4146311.1 hypothetical protein HBH44_244230 [Parastagonospora nodorum]KAH4577140.1 hypothetical protein HBH84_069870 [Parastagonospora nodorum]